MDVVDRFALRFRGLDRAHGTYQVGQSADKRGKVGGRARTVKESVTKNKWSDHLSGKTGIGIVPVTDEGQCWFGAIDVDVYDLNLEALEAKIIRSNLPLVVCRTKSGGAHLYLFIKAGASAAVVRDTLAEWSVFLGYPAVEVFPKQGQLASEDDVGSWINLPYFDHIRTTRYAIKNGAALSLEEFLDYADTMAVLENKLASIKLKVDDELKDGPPCLQHLAGAGFPEGTRNKALFNLGVFARTKYGDEWHKRLDDFNRKYLVPPLSSSEVKQIAQSLGRKEYSYTCKEAPIAAACNRSICSRRPYGIGGFRNDPGIALDGLSKILTDPPMWVLNVNGRRLLLNTTEDLINQRFFIKQCMDAFNILPQRVAAPAWDDLIRTLLDKVEEIEAPEDAGTVGQFMFLLEQFCTEQSAAINREELLVGKPYSEAGITYFRSPDLLQYFERHRFRTNAKEAWNILRERGAITRQFKIKKRCVRCWGINEFDQQLEPLSVPDIGDDF